MDFKTFSSMDTESLIITILISILVTAIAYLFVPCVLSIAKAKFFSLSTIRTIVIINGMVVFIAFNIVRVYLGDEVSFNFVPAFLWSSIAYALMRKFCLYTEDDFDESFEDENLEEQIEIEKTVQKTDTLVNLSWENEHSARQDNPTGYFVYSEDITLNSQIQHDTEPNFNQIKSYTQPKTPEKKTKSRWKPILIFSAISLSLIILTTSLVFNIIQNEKNSELAKDNKRLKELYDDMAQDYIDLKYSNIDVYDKADFLDKHIVFVIEGYGDYYFTYDQMMLVTEYEEEYSYWAYNKEQAIGKGYVKFIN